MELPALIMDPIGDMLGSVEGISFLLLSIFAIGGAVGTVRARRVAHSMLYLIGAFFAVAGVFLMAGAEMLAAIQILVYLGSVMLVYAFGVMLSRRQIQEEDFE